MNIDDAIEHLKELKEEGATHVIFEAWPAGFFDRKNTDPEWPRIAEAVMFDGDWSTINTSIQEMFKDADIVTEQLPSTEDLLAEQQGSIPHESDEFEA